MQLHVQVLDWRPFSSPEVSTPYRLLIRSKKLRLSNCCSSSPSGDLAGMSRDCGSRVSTNMTVLGNGLPWTDAIGSIKTGHIIPLILWLINNRHRKDSTLQQEYSHTLQTCNGNIWHCQSSASLARPPDIQYPGHTWMPAWTIIPDSSRVAHLPGHVDVRFQAVLTSDGNR